MHSVMYSLVVMTSFSSVSAEEEQWQLQQWDAEEEKWQLQQCDAEEEQWRLQQPGSNVTAATPAAADADATHGTHLELGGKSSAIRP